MTTYNIQNTNGITVTTISPGTTTGSTFPIELPGQGLSLYGQIVDQNLYRMLENFSKSTPPTNPVEGQFWYDNVNKQPNYWNGTAWVLLATGGNSGFVRFRMEAAATNINFAAAGSTTIFVHPGSSARYYPTGIMLLPRTALNVATPAGFNLQNLVAEDILETVLVTQPTGTKTGFFLIAGMTEPVTVGNSITLNVTAPATGSGVQLRYDALLFGLVR